jgi:hypothetical protein
MSKEAEAIVRRYWRQLELQLQRVALVAGCGWHTQQQLWQALADLHHRSSTNSSNSSSTWCYICCSHPQPQQLRLLTCLPVLQPSTAATAHSPPHMCYAACLPSCLRLHHSVLHFAGAMLDMASLRERLSMQERTYPSDFLVSHALVT